MFTNIYCLLIQIGSRPGTVCLVWRILGKCLTETCATDVTTSVRTL